MHTHTEGSLSTWAQTMVTVMGKLQETPIAFIEVFNCKERLAWTERLYEQPKAAAEFGRCRGPKTSAYMEHQHLSVCTLHGGLSVRVTPEF